MKTKQNLIRGGIIYSKDTAECLSGREHDAIARA